MNNSRKPRIGPHTLSVMGRNNTLFVQDNISMTNSWHVHTNSCHQTPNYCSNWTLNLLFIKIPILQQKMTHPPSRGYKSKLVKCKMFTICNRLGNSYSRNGNAKTKAHFLTKNMKDKIAFINWIRTAAIF